MQVDQFKNSIMTKIIFIGFLIITFFIPLGMVDSIIKEREKRRDEAIKEVSLKWGYAQKIMGPVLTVPYKYHYRDDKKIMRVTIKNAYFLPETLMVNGNVIPEKRKRGLYEVVLYKIDNFNISGKFKLPDFKKLRINSENILWDESFITFGIPDTRGIQKEIIMKWNNRKIGMLPGTKNSSVSRYGIHANILNLKKSKKRKFAFELRLSLRGSYSLSFVPLGKETKVKLTSTWEHPSFYGAYLPDKREINSEGFSAQWKISYFGRNYPQQWTEDRKFDFSNDSSFGVEMYVPVDFYQKCERAIKYGFLFIFLTFLSFFLFEIFSKLKIHPLQYLMVGFAMSLFYLLFLSLSEHMNFIASYILSCAGVITMITGYSFTILKTRVRGYIMSILLVCLYGYLFILLQNQDYTLLLGSIALFIILGVVMYITRNINWYKVNLNLNE